MKFIFMNFPCFQRNDNDDNNNKVYLKSKHTKLAKLDGKDICETIRYIQRQLKKLQQN